MQEYRMLPSTFNLIPIIYCGRGVRPVPEGVAYVHIAYACACICGGTWYKSHHVCTVLACVIEVLEPEDNCFKAVSTGVQQPLYSLHLVVQKATLKKPCLVYAGSFSQYGTCVFEGRSSHREAI